jgi:site-specific recombinase XerD
MIETTKRSLTLEANNMHAEPSVNQTPPQVEAVFDQWLEARMSAAWNGDRVKSPSTQKHYRAIWKLWRQHLTDHQTPWHQATPELVHGFLQKIRARRAVNADGAVRSASVVSRDRYWTLISRIYEWAHARGMTTSNPAESMQEADIPPSVLLESSVLNPILWRALPKAFPDPLEANAFDLRDLAILQLLYHHGLTGEEIRELSISDLIWPPGLAGMRTTTSVSRPKGIRIVGTRIRQAREIIFSKPCQVALLKWLNARRMIPSIHGHEFLFMTNRANQLSIRMLFHLVANTIERAASACGQEPPAKRGPQVIRNTVIHHWIDSGMSLPEVCALAGLKNAKSLLRHRHT